MPEKKKAKSNVERRSGWEKGADSEVFLLSLSIRCQGRDRRERANHRKKEGLARKQLQFAHINMGSGSV
eukprot:6173560-Pleurochrysis_carterae.AAC.1